MYMYTQNLMPVVCNVTVCTMSCTYTIAVMSVVCNVTVYVHMCVTYAVYKQATPRHNLSKVIESG
jgi:hypothetical protein